MSLFVRDGRLAAWHAFSCRVACVIAALGACHALAADESRPRLQTIWDLPHPGGARFCYDVNPAVIFFRYDKAANKTSIIKKELNGDERTIAEFPKFRNETSLSCSEDGMTVAALGDDIDGNGAELFIARGGQISRYRFSRDYPLSVVGVHSLLSPDGRSVALPEIPTLVSGPDFLKEMRVFVSQDGHEVFFARDYAYLDRDKTIEKYAYEQHEWKRREIFVQPPKFGVYEITRCGKRDIATLSDDETVRLRVLDKREPDRHDWLESIGVRKILQKYHNLIVITGSYEYCAVPLQRADKRGLIAEGLIRVGPKLKRFSFADPNVVLADRYVSFSKDGCYALIIMVQVPRSPQLISPQQVRLLGVSPEQCKP